MKLGPEDSSDQSPPLWHKAKVFQQMLSFIQTVQASELGRPLELQRFTSLEGNVQSANQKFSEEGIINIRVQLPPGTVVGFLMDRCVDYRQLCAQETGRYTGMSAMREQFSPFTSGVWPMAFHQIRLERDYTAPIMPLPSDEVIVPTMFETVELLD